MADTKTQGGLTEANIKELLQPGENALEQAQEKLDACKKAAPQLAKRWEAAEREFILVRDNFNAYKESIWNDYYLLYLDTPDYAEIIQRLQEILRSQKTLHIIRDIPQNFLQHMLQQKARYVPDSVEAKAEEHKSEAKAKEHKVEAKAKAVPDHHQELHDYLKNLLEPGKKNLDAAKKMLAYCRKTMPQLNVNWDLAEQTYKLTSNKFAGYEEAMHEYARRIEELYRSMELSGLTESAQALEQELQQLARKSSYWISDAPGDFYKELELQKNYYEIAVQDPILFKQADEAVKDDGGSEDDADYPQKLIEAARKIKQESQRNVAELEAKLKKLALETEMTNRKQRVEAIAKKLTACQKKLAEAKSILGQCGRECADKPQFLSQLAGKEKNYRDIYSYLQQIDHSCRNFSTAAGREDALLDGFMKEFNLDLFVSELQSFLNMIQTAAKTPRPT